jgi:alpha-mannosidase
MDEPGGGEGAAVGPDRGDSPGRWRVITLLANDGQEPPPDLSDGDARSAWAAVSAPWHPAVLAASKALPAQEDAAFASSPAADEVRLVAAGARGRLPSGHDTGAADAGTILVDGLYHREAQVVALRERLGATADPPEDDRRAALAADFLALGTTKWWLRDLTLAMGHADCLDVASLTREAIAGARAWCEGDWPTAGNRLRAAFEVLTQARERFYPVDAYFVDVCLVDPGAPAGALAAALDARAPVSFLAPARAIENQAARDPGAMERLRQAIDEGWADVVGGAYGEPDEPLRPLESVLWQFRRAYWTYRRHLDDRAVETLARRRSGLYPLLPQVAKRFAFRFALHWALDGGGFPIPAESKRLWEALDGSHLESLTRPPIAADKEAEGARLAWRLGRSMRDDHVATIPLVHWPEPVAGWFKDLRRVAAYSPVLARWVTLGDYFHLTDRPYDLLHPEVDAYHFPYLAQAVARRDGSPIGRRVEATALRAEVDGLAMLEALAHALRGAPPEPPPGDAAEPAAAASGPVERDPWISDDLVAAEDAAESGRLAEAQGAVAALRDRRAAEVAGLILGAAATGGGGGPGYLVINPLAVPRRVAVTLPDAPANLPAGGAVRAAQLTEDGVRAVVDLPAFGYAWIAREPAGDGAGDGSPIVEPPRTLAARDRTLVHEAMEVDIDPATGGLRAVRGPGESQARLGQQLVIVGLTGADGQAATSRMVADRFEVEYAGPALLRCVTEGALNDPVDGRPLARFRQEASLWVGRPALELAITLSALDPSWVSSLATGDPWGRYLACRWAWPDPDADLRRCQFLTPLATNAERPETAEALDIATRHQRTGLLFGGLAHHRRHGARMLDTLLVAGSESGRTARVGVTLDLSHPYQAVQDRLGPVYVVPAAGGPPPTGPSGWFFQLEGKTVAVTRVEPVSRSGGDRGWGLAFHLLETAGRSTRARLRLFRTPVWARQTDLLGDLLVDLAVDGDTVLIDLTPHELARIDVTLG